MLTSWSWLEDPQSEFMEWKDVGEKEMWFTDSRVLTLMTVLESEGESGL